jgi:syntaxin 6
MSLEDPFFMVKNEVVQSVSQVIGLHKKWQDLHNNSSTYGNSEYSWTLNHLKENIKTIHWDLEDLGETIETVESNPYKYNISLIEINARKQFIHETKTTIDKISADINNGSKAKAAAFSRMELLESKSNKYEKLDRELENQNQNVIADHQLRRKMELEDQDQNLEKVGETVITLKHLGEEIGRELDSQNILLEDLDQKVSSTGTQLSKVTKKIDEILQMSDKYQLIIIVTLVVILLSMIIIYSVL